MGMSIYFNYVLGVLVAFCLILAGCGGGSNSGDSTSKTAPSITSGDNASFTVGVAGNFTVTASGSPAPTLSYSGVLPAGVTFNAASGILSGVPTSAAGNFPITFIANNGVSPNATQNFTLTINVPIQTDPSNIAFNKPVSASYTPDFGSPALITNGIMAPEGTVWNDWSYAVQVAGTLTVDLGQTYGGINRIIVQADDNDNYKVEYSIDGSAWTIMYDIPLGTDHGLRSRDSGPLPPVSARYIRLSVTGGDSWYSVSEIQAFKNP
jgi:hypothetical protein